MLYTTKNLQGSVTNTAWSLSPGRLYTTKNLQGSVTSNKLYHNFNYLNTLISNLLYFV